MNNQPQNEVVLHTCGHVVLYTMPAAPAAVLNERLQTLKHMPCMHCQARGCHSGATTVATSVATPSEFARYALKLHATTVATPSPRRRHARARAQAHSPYALTWAQALAALAATQDAAMLALLCLLALVCAAMLALLEGALG